MFASWPMVFGALVAGLIAGFLIPEATQKQKAASSSVVAVKTAETTKTAAPKRALPTPTADSAPAPAPVTKDTSTSTPQKSAENEDCERQTWPYLTPNCLDRSAQAAKPDVVVKTKIDEPKPEAHSEPKSAQTPVAPATTGSTPATTGSTPATTAKTDSMPKSDNTPKADPAPETRNAAANPAPAPKTDPSAAPKSAATSPAPNEVKQEPAQAAAPAPEKSARRPAPRARTEARAEVLDEPPLRPRAERYRGERRYAGQHYEDDRPVYIERGGRLYLAPEHHYRLRGPDRYWREW